MSVFCTHHFFSLYTLNLCIHAFVCWNGFIPITAEMKLNPCVCTCHRIYSNSQSKQMMMVMILNWLLRNRVPVFMLLLLMLITLSCLPVAFTFRSSFSFCGYYYCCDHSVSYSLLCRYCRYLCCALASAFLVDYINSDDQLFGSARSVPLFFFFFHLLNILSVVICSNWLKNSKWIHQKPGKKSNKTNHFHCVSQNLPSYSIKR